MLSKFSISMKAVLALLLGVAYGGQETAWLRDVNRNWDSLDHQKSFKNWQARFGKNYGNDEEEAYRFLQFLDNWEMINDHNSKGEHNYTLGLNQFGDLSVEEFQYYVHGDLNGCLRRKKPAPKYKKDRSPKYQKPKNQANPAAVDWTNVDGKSYVTPVKNQEQCGSCWAFSTTGSLESRYAILRAKDGRFMFQHLMQIADENSNTIYADMSKIYASLQHRCGWKELLLIKNQTFVDRQDHDKVGLLR